MKTPDSTDLPSRIAKCNRNGDLPPRYFHKSSKRGFKKAANKAFLEKLSKAAMLQAVMNSAFSDYSPARFMRLPDSELKTH